MSSFVKFVQYMFRYLYTKLAAAQHQIGKTFFRFPFVFSFSAFTILNLWFALHDRTTPYFNGVSAITNSRQATEAWGWSDSGSYLQMGIAQAKFGQLPENLMWTAIFWPPGMGYLNAFAIKMVGLEGQFIFVLAAVTALLWGLVMSLILQILRAFMRFWIALLVVAAVIQTDLYHQYLVRDAIIWSDGYAAAFICLTILFSYLGYSKFKVRYFALSGFSLAVLAHIRGQYFVVVQFFVVLIVCLLAINLMVFAFKKLWGYGLGSSKNRNFFKAGTAPLAMLSLAALLACFPYLLWQKNNVGDLPWDLKGKWHWTSTDAFAAMGNWMKTEDLAGFVRDGGGGTACKVDPPLCDSINELEKEHPSPFSIYDSEPYSAKHFSAMTLKTFRENPVKWFQVKIPYVLRYWDSRPAISGPSGSDFPTSELSALGLATLALSFFFKRARKLFLIPAFISVILIGATVGPPYLAHFEVRYLVAVKLIGLIVLASSAGFLMNLIANKTLKHGVKPKEILAEVF